MIKLTSAEPSSEGRDLYLNPDHIIVITATTSGSRVGTTATADGGQTYFHRVQEDADQVVEIIGKFRSSR